MKATGVRRQEEPAPRLERANHGPVTHNYPALLLKSPELRLGQGQVLCDSALDSDAGTVKFSLQAPCYTRAFLAGGEGVVRRPGRDALWSQGQG